MNPSSFRSYGLSSLKFLLLILVVSGALFACEDDWNLKELKVYSSSIQLLGMLEGRVKGITEADDRSVIGLGKVGEAGEEANIEVFPSMREWPERFRVQVGEGVSMNQRSTIGDRTVELRISDAEKPRLVIATGHTRSLLTPPDGESYQINLKEMLASSTPQLRLSGPDGNLITVAPGEKVRLGSDWVFYLVKMYLDKKYFSGDSGISREWAPLNFDYILYRD